MLVCTFACHVISTATKSVLTSFFGRHGAYPAYLKIVLQPRVGLCDIPQLQDVFRNFLVTAFVHMQ